MEGSFFMWTVIYLIKTRDKALKMQEVLKEAKILCKIRPAAPGNDSYMEVLVPDAEKEQAHLVLLEKGF